MKSINIVGLAFGLSSAVFLVASSAASAQTRDVEYYLCLHAKECDGAVGVDESQSTSAPDTKGFRIGGAPTARPQVSTGGKSTRPKPVANAVNVAQSSRKYEPSAVSGGEIRTAAISSSKGNSKNSMRKQGRGAGVTTRAAVSNHKMLSEYGGGVSSNDLLIGFELNSDRLNSDAKAEAAVFARALNMPQLKNKRFVITGHTDSSGGLEYNKILSQRRAEAVVNYLVSKGVGRDRFEAQGAGYSNPLPKLSAASALNRRVEAVVAGE